MQVIVVKYSNYVFGFKTDKLMTTVLDCDISPVPNSGELVLGTTLYDDQTKCVINTQELLGAYKDDIGAYLIFTDIVVPVSYVLHVVNVDARNLLPINSFMDSDNTNVLDSILVDNNELCFILSLDNILSKVS